MGKNKAFRRRHGGCGSEDLQVERTAGRTECEVKFLVCGWEEQSFALEAWTRLIH